MSILRRNALVGSIVWFFAVVIFLGLFFTSESPDVFMRDKPRKLLSVIPIAIGYLVHFYILWSTCYSIKVLNRSQLDKDVTNHC